MTEVQRTQRTLALTGEMRRTRRRTCTAFRVMTGTCVKLQKSVIVASGDGRIKGSCVLCVDESSVNNREQSGEIYFFVETGE